MHNQNRQAAIGRAAPSSEEEMMPDEAPEADPAVDAGGAPVPISDIAMYLKAILPSLPQEQQAAVAQAAEILTSVAPQETPQEVPVESGGVDSEAMGGVPARY
jgi:hypothetical protein